MTGLRCGSYRSLVNAYLIDTFPLLLILRSVTRRHLWGELFIPKHPKHCHLLPAVVFTHLDSFGVSCRALEITAIDMSAHSG